jgi:hypothetical protein
MSNSAAFQRPAPGVGVFFIDGDCLLFSAPAQQAFALNTAAGVIWCWIEDGLSRDAIISRLSEEFALSPAISETFLDEAATLFHSFGLVEGATTQPAAPIAAPVVDARISLIEPARVRRYRLLDQEIEIRCGSTEQDAIIHPILAHLASEADGAADLSLDVVSDSRSIHIGRNGALCAECATHDELAPLMKSLVWAEAVNSSDFLFGFHAGVVANGAGALMLPGRSGSGKSTLTALLVASGLAYLSDEMALLSRGTFEVRSLPLAFCIKDSGIQALATPFPELCAQPVHSRGDGKRVLYMTPKPQWLLPVGETRQVKAIVFPTYHAETDLKLDRLTSGETVRRLLTDCLVVGKTVELADVEDLISWVQGLPCWSMTFGSSPQAVAALKPILEFGDAL